MPPNIIKEIVKSQLLITFFSIFILVWFCHWVESINLKLASVKYYSYAQNTVKQIDNNHQTGIKKTEQYNMIFGIIQIFILRRLFMFIYAWIYNHILGNNQTFQRLINTILSIFAKQQENSTLKRQLKVSHYQNEKTIGNQKQLVILCSFLLSISTFLIYCSIVYNECMIFIALKSSVPLLIFLSSFIMTILCCGSSSTSLYHTDSNIKTPINIKKCMVQFIIILLIVASVTIYKLILKNQSFFVFVQMNILSIQTFILICSVVVDVIVPILIKRILKQVSIMRFMQEVNKLYLIFTVIIFTFINKQLPFKYLPQYVEKHLNWQYLIEGGYYLIIFATLSFSIQIILLTILKQYKTYTMSLILVSKLILYNGMTQKIGYFTVKSDIIKLCLTIVVFAGLGVNVYQVKQNWQNQNLCGKRDGKFNKISMEQEDQSKRLKVNQ